MAASVRGLGFTVYARLALARALLPGGVVQPALVYEGRVYGLGSWGYSDVREVMLEVQPEEFERLARLVASRDKGLPLHAVRLAAPVERPGKIVCIGVNYKAHAVESGVEVPPAPNLFVKTSNAIVGPGDPVVVHGSELDVDAEVELAAVIGLPARSLEPEEALDAVWGFTVLNDFTSRREQVDLGVSQWWRAKSHDTYSPTGPVVVPRTELDHRNVELSLTVDGRLARKGNTRDMVYSVEEIVSWASIATLLEPGDIISTGTPAGVGEHGKPPVAPEDGSVMEACAEGVGCIENRVVVDEGLNVRRWAGKASF